MEDDYPHEMWLKNLDEDFLVEVPLAHADPRFEGFVEAAIARRNRNLRGTA